ncbi:hypothetical protein HELRODRAFT_182402 [Helobdella robusta]|uniref:G-protein coupled receptors family 2 profile 2 domain-containing protein n=1 Tax=Helobdella robusta TaxID=6412 RepID=T1FI53_HELRO|nr:hypothetical protein HELRODRAFT_182402 [Helobdella robusta]ESN90936.1 hypothetical protein HELRODRAFT_182402 [Helobdella robusta]
MIFIINNNMVITINNNMVITINNNMVITINNNMVIIINNDIINNNMILIIITDNMIIIVINNNMLQSHPHEPNNFRRALKATCMLVPLFGLHFIFTLSRPKSTHPEFINNSGLITYDESKWHHYHYMIDSIINSQGFVVSIIYCFLNEEVLGHLSRMSACFRGHPTTQIFTMASDIRRRSDAESIRNGFHSSHKDDNRMAAAMEMKDL